MKIIIMVTAIVITALVIWTIYLFFNAKFVPPSPKSTFAPVIYYYQNPKISLKNIKLKVVYFAPKNREIFIPEDWRTLIQTNLEKIKKFHEFQFNGFSILSFDIYSHPVIGLEENLFYDSVDTGKGNPQALRAIDEELEKRLFNTGGDLYNEIFSEKKKNEYAVAIYIYEGVGASAALEPEGAMILSMDFFRKKQFLDLGPVTLYHELAHTFGLADQYDYETNVVFSDDIMGAGRRKPLEYTYILDETKRLMGL